jgi:hypothetical protein
MPTSNTLTHQLLQVLRHHLPTCNVTLVANATTAPPHSSIPVSTSKWADARKPSLRWRLPALHGVHAEQYAAESLARLVQHYTITGQRSMFTACQPYVSVVVAARNDDYGDGFMDRLQNFVNSFAFESYRHALCAEIVVVDWESEVAGSVFSRIRWPDTLVGGARVIAVPRGTAAWLMHSQERIARYAPSDELRQQLQAFGVFPMYEYVAKNVGARRAKAPFLLICNPDSVISSEIIEYIARRHLSTSHFYRAPRVPARESLDPFSVADSDIIERLKGKRRNIWGGCRRIKAHTDVCG